MPGRWRVRIGRVVQLLGTLVLFLMAGFFVLTRTGPGYRLILRVGLDQANGALPGTITVGDISSAGILKGVKLREVRFDAPDGTPFVRVDSVQVSYSLLPLLRREIRLGPGEVWGADVLIQQLPGEDRLNVLRAVEDPPDSILDAAAMKEAQGPPSIRWLTLSGIRIHDSHVRIRLPAPDEGPVGIGYIVELDDGRRVRELDFRDLNAAVPEGVIRAPGQEGEQVVLASASATADFLSEPVRLEDLRGTVRRQGGFVELNSPRIWLTRTEAAGTARIDWSIPGEVQAWADLVVDVASSEDLGWLPFPVPEAEGAAEFALERTPEVFRLDFRELDVTLETGGRVEGDLTVDLQPEIVLSNVDLRLDRLDSRVLDVWMDDSPVTPLLASGMVRLAGPFRSLQLDSRISFADPLGGLRRSLGEATGVIHVQDPLGFTGLRVVLDSLDYRWLNRLIPGMSTAPDSGKIPLSGRGRVAGNLSGRLGEGLTFDATARYRWRDQAPSFVSVQGQLAGAGQDARVTAQGSMDPLSLGSLGAEFDLPLRGSISGTFQAEGSLESMQVRGVTVLGAGADSPFAGVDAELPQDTLFVAVGLNLLDLAAGYELDLSTPGFHFPSVVSFLPQDSRITARVQYRGSGFDPDSLVGSGTVSLWASHFGGLRLDTAFTSLDLRGGILALDTVLVGTSALNLDGFGDLGIVSGAPAGRVELAVAAPNLDGIRPLIRQRQVVARDTLDALEREALVMAGVDPDTLPLLEEVDVSGSARGTLVLEGRLGDFGAQASLEVRDGRWGRDRVDAAQIRVLATGLPGLEGSWSGQIRTDSLIVRGKEFRAATVDFEFQDPRGTGQIRLEKSDTDDYLARGSVEVIDGSTQVFLDQLTLRFDQDQWNLGGPAGFTLRGDSLQVQDLVLLRQGTDPMRLEAGGTLTQSGPTNFELRARGLDLARIDRLLQTDQGLAGVVDTDLSVTGIGTAPRVDGSLAGVGIRWHSVAFDTLVVEVLGADNRLQGNLNAWLDGNRTITAAADMPVDLSLARLEERFPTEPLDIRVALSRLPAATIMGFVPVLEDVEGYLDGTITFQGTVDALRPGGTVTLTEGAAYLGAIGVRHTEVQATASLMADRRVELEGSLRAGGTATVQGTITLDTLSNPRFDLEFNTDRLQGVNRRDLSGVLSGTANLTGRFMRPSVAGDITVNQGELSLEEFVRSASVVDVSEPGLEFQALLETQFSSLQPVIVQSQNPFMNNLNMDVDLHLPGGTWIRSQELDVELSGDLSLLWDRRENSLVLSGELQAIRGAYNNFGRRFQVQEGVIRFAGTPDLNPTLSIRTETRIRTTRGEPLDIQATVEGTLAEPRVSLSSDFQPPIAEADLLSYLLFGQPSYGLTQQGAATQAGLGFALGYLSSQVGSQLAQGIPFLDYVSVTARPEGQGGAAAVSANNSVLNTSVEGGLYLTDDVFLGFRVPISTTPSGNRQPDAWVELTFLEPWTIEAFYEDRFARDRVSGLGNLSFTTSKIWGLLVYREWGY